MQLEHLWLTDFRNATAATIDLPAEGLTVIKGRNGEGKTNILEAVAWLATLESFRGAPTEALVRDGAESAIVRAAGRQGGRELLVEGEISRRGRARVQVNRQPLRRSRDLLGALRVSVFSPDDLALLKGGPAERRRYLDDLLVACHPRWDALRGEVDRILRQRGALLKQAGGRLTGDTAPTLDVWDAKLAQAGTELADARAALTARLQPAVASSYGQLAGQPLPVALAYEAPWRSDSGGPGLGEALALARSDDVRRGVSTVGPHRDDLVIFLEGMVARTHASQGEQRCLALALRLAGHTVVGEEVGEAPILLLDDVFSELDPDRSRALLEHLPKGQALLTTAGPLPEGVAPAAHLVVRAGAVMREDPSPPGRLAIIDGADAADG
ncbi:MAG TPA: DNA replication/repair protein RecF [Acidimicrobiales bacterium]